MGRTRREFSFGSMISVTPHRLIDLSSPRVDAAVEVDGVVKTSISQKVDDTLAAGAMMTNNHQRSIGRKVGGVRRNFPHWNMEGAFELAYVQFSRFPHIENNMLASCVSQIQQFASRHLL
jgi:hypothetical protein